MFRHNELYNQLDDLGEMVGWKEAYQTLIRGFSTDELKENLDYMKEQFEIEDESETDETDEESED